MRAPIDLQTSFLDLSQVYGANDALAGLLREEDSGRLVAGPGDVLPKLADIAAAHPSLDAHAIGGILRANGFGAGGTYIGGDLRLNQQSGLTSGQTLFMLNHNWHADRSRRCSRRSAIRSSPPANGPSGTRVGVPAALPRRKSSPASPEIRSSPEVGHDAVIALDDGSITVDHFGVDAFTASNFAYSDILDLSS